MYKEKDAFGNHYRETYLRGLYKVVSERYAQAEQKRDDYIGSLPQNREVYRKEYIDMLGWPLNEAPQGIQSIKEVPVYETETELCVRMQFELFEDFWFYGILFRHKTDEKLPLVISQHGGWGTPEFCSSLLESGSDNYNDMSMRVFRQGVNVFAPQLDLWQEERFGQDNHRDEIDLQLKQLGGSIAALEIYSIMRCLDYFEKQEYCNQSFGMCGLSYGGFYTLYTTAADTRIKAALSSSHFNDRFKYGWMSKNFYNAANIFFDAEVAGLVCPRYLDIHVGEKDELFDWQSAEREYERAKKFYEVAPGKLGFHVFSGKHEFCPQDDVAIERFVAEIK